MEYFYSQILENNQNADFISNLQRFAQNTRRQVYLLRKPLTDSKYEYDIKDVGIVLMRE